MGSRLEGGGRRVLVALALLLAAGCYWTKYDKLTRTHVQLLLSMAEKLAGVIGEDGVPPASLAEYRYPLERARDFTRIVAPRFEGRPSLAAFRRLCDAYQDVLNATERLSADHSSEAHAAFEQAHTRLRDDATVVVQALDAEVR